MRTIVDIEKWEVGSEVRRLRVWKDGQNYFVSVQATWVGEQSTQIIEARIGLTWRELLEVALKMAASDDVVPQ
jgi:hypothetical protein